jgi:hypothetical protein
MGVNVESGRGLIFWKGSIAINLQCLKRGLW